MEEQDLRMRPLLKNSYQKKKRPRSVPSRLRQNVAVNYCEENDHKFKESSSSQTEIKTDQSDFISKKPPDLSKLEITSFIESANGKQQRLDPNDQNCIYKKLTRSLDLSQVRNSANSSCNSGKPPRPTMLSGSSSNFKLEHNEDSFSRELFEMMRQSLRMSESVHREVVKLRQELNTLDTAFNEFKTMTNNRVEQISTSLKEIARTKVGTMICFRCHGYVLEHIQLQCGHIYCLHCINISFIPDVKIQERTAEALREVATKRKCPNCGDRKVDVSIIKKKYRV